MGRRIGLLIVLAGALLGWLSAHTEILFADGLRYVRQAQTLERGSWTEGLLRAVDHPVYPLEIALAHRLIGGEGPESWQAAAQAAAIAAGILLVVPLYLVARELFGDASAWLACAVDVRRAADRPRLRRRAQREHLPALLDLGILDGPAVPSRRPIRLAAADDRPGRSGLSEPPGRTAAAAGAGRDPRASCPSAAASV